MKSSKSAHKAPSIRQKKTLENLGKGMSLGKAMREAGYKDTYADNPQQLKKKLSWKELLDKYVPERAVAGGINKLLNSTTTRRFQFANGYSEVQIHGLMRNLGFKKSQYIATKTFETKYTKDGDPYEVYFWEVVARVINGVDVYRGVDTTMRARGKYEPDQIRIIDDEFEDETDEELEDRLARLKKEKRYHLIQEAKKRRKENAGK